MLCTVQKSVILQVFDPQTSLHRTLPHLPSHITDSQPPSLPETPHSTQQQPTHLLPPSLPAAPAQVSKLVNDSFLIQTEHPSPNHTENLCLSRHGHFRHPKLIPFPFPSLFRPYLSSVEHNNGRGRDRPLRRDRRG